MDLIQGQKQLNKFLRLFLVGLLLLAAGPGLMAQGQDKDITKKLQWISTS